MEKQLGDRRRFLAGIGTLVLIGALATAGLAGWGIYWIAGTPAAGEFARKVWHWLTPGWGAAGRTLLAIAGGCLVVSVLAAGSWARTPRNRASRRVVRPWSLLPTIAVAVFGGLLLVWIGYVVIDHALNPTEGAPPTRIDVLKTALTAVAGVGGAVALVVAYRRQRDLEQGRFIERFGAASDQLGNADPAVRIAGVYAMVSTADEATSFVRRQQCIDVLCGYIRLPYDPQHGANHHTEVITTQKSAATKTGQEVAFRQVFRQNDGQVRQTILDVVADHLAEKATVSWSEHYFDFRHACLENFHLRDVHFKGGTMNFRSAKFTGDYTLFQYSSFSNFVNLTQAQFHAQRAGFMECVFESGARFREASFTGISAEFRTVSFKGDELDFHKAIFKTVEENRFDSVAFDAATTLFTGTEFDSDLTIFHESKFTGNIADFGGSKFHARLTGILDCTFGANDMSFERCSFKNVNFLENEFTGGRVSFEEPRLWHKTVTPWDDSPDKTPDSLTPKHPNWPPIVVKDEIPPWVREQPGR